MSATGMTLDSGLTVQRDTVARALRRTTRIGFAMLALLLVYLTYTWFAFDVPALIKSAKPEQAALLATDAVAHKVHVTRLLRRGTTSIAIEGSGRRPTRRRPTGWPSMGRN